MADTYYFRLTAMSPKSLASMNPQRGVVVAETATTGKFLINEVTFDQIVSPNSDSSVAYNITGEMKIVEPLGARFLDYLRYAAIKAGCANHLDARYILDMELRAENYTSGEFLFSFPIMLLVMEMKSSISEKGTEYIIRFSPAAHHSQTDMTQPIKDTVTVKGVSTLKDYFDGLSKELETNEFKHAEARQKEGGKKAGGGNHPAAADPKHDEYYFLLDPLLEKMAFNSKESAELARTGSFYNVIDRYVNKKFDVTAKSGTTIVSQVTRVLQQTDGISALMPGRSVPQTKDGQGSSADNAAANESSLGDIHRFFRIETHTVYKDFDKIRGRYAVKHIFAIFLADQPNMYQYPDEIDKLNEEAAQGKVLAKLNTYITRGLLRKAYYHYYTGLNSDVIKANLQFNMMYYLPSFPVQWTDRGTTSDGKMNKQNYNKEKTPYSYGDKEVADASATWKFAEDAGFDSVTEVIRKAGAALRPRMEPTEPVKQSDSAKSENEELVNKIFEVQTSPYDLMELELEIFGDPYWLGTPNLMMAGQKGLAKINVSDGMKQKILSELPGIDSDFSSRSHSWSNYDQAQYYMGGNLIYYNSQLPTNDGLDDIMEFSTSDQIVGIYMVWKIKNDFKEGKWTQILYTKRDLTIPSKFIPLAAMGGASGSNSGFQAYVDNVVSASKQPGASGKGGTNAQQQPNTNPNKERAEQLKQQNMGGSR